MKHHNQSSSFFRLTVAPLFAVFLNHKEHLILVLLVIFTLGLNLIPSNRMFLFHDQTQYARVMEFAKAVTTMQIPPVYAADFNFGIGYPIFLFYAPLAYWVSALLYLLGFGPIYAVQLSFLLALTIAASGMYSWLNRRYNRIGSFMGALLYAASPWFASEIFVRGNLATAWFLALAPWSLWALTRTHERRVIKICIISLTFVTHNALSLLWMPTLIVYALLGHRRYRLSRVLLIGIALVLSGVFWVPALFQLNKTYATAVAALTNYHDHFLCLHQIWTAPSWGFGGSAKGCAADGMSFMLGKLQIIFALLGFFGGVIFMKKRLHLFLHGLIMLWAVFLTLYDATPFWELLKPLQVIQFPWRLLSIALLFVSALGGAAFHLIWEHVKIVSESDRLGINKLYKKTAKTYASYLSTAVSPVINEKNIILHIPSFPYFVGGVVCFVFSVGLIVGSLKFFQGREVPVSDITNQFASKRYIQLQAAYDAPEYVPKTVDYAYWSTFRTKTPQEKDLLLLKKQFGAFKPNALYQLVAAVFAVLGLALILI